MKFILRLIAVIVAVSACASVTRAQQMEDVLYLKNGSIIHGIIIEQIPNVSIKIKTNEGNIFAYKFEEIEKFTKEEVKGSLYGDNNSKKIGEYGFKEKKFFAGLKAGYGDWGNLTYGLSFDYAISNTIGLGLDAAYTTWDENAYSFTDYDSTHGYTSYNLKYSYNLIGLLVNFSYHFNPGEKFDPYIKAGGGYFLINSSTKWSPRTPSSFVDYFPVAQSSGIGYGGQAGFNYFFTKSFSLSISGGWPFYASGGVTMRF